MKIILQFISRALLSIPLALGWVAGFCARCVRLTWAAVQEGFQLGNGL